MQTCSLFENSSRFKFSSRIRFPFLVPLLCGKIQFFAHRIIRLSSGKLGIVGHGFQNNLEHFCLRWNRHNIVSYCVSYFASVLPLYQWREEAALYFKGAGDLVYNRLKTKLLQFFAGLHSAVNFQTAHPAKSMQTA